MRFSLKELILIGIVIWGSWYTYQRHFNKAAPIVEQRAGVAAVIIGNGDGTETILYDRRKR